MRKHPWLKDTPRCIRYNALCAVVKADDSNTAKRDHMRARGETKRHKYAIKYRSRKQPSSWTIEVDGRDIKRVETIDRPKTRYKNDTKHAGRRKWAKVSLFEKALGGPLLLTEPVPSDIKYAAVKITRNRLRHFHMHVQWSCTKWEELPRPKPEAEREVVALDPGVRTFQTFYSPNKDFGSYATGEYGYAKVYSEAKRCDKTIAKMVAAKEKGELTYRHKRNMMKSKHRSIERVRNLVSEVHRKVANDLCNNYDTIMLPVFESQKIVRKPRTEGEKRRAIGSKIARALLMWRHYEFRQYLASKVLMRGKELSVVTEEYTTQCCGKCGTRNENLGGARKYKCVDAACGFKCGRDENAARNIFLKYLKE